MKLRNSLNGMLVALVFFQTNLQNASASMRGDSPMKRRLEYDDSTGMNVGPMKRTFKIDDTEVPFYLREDSPNKLTRSNAIDVRKRKCSFRMGDMISVLDESQIEPSSFEDSSNKPSLAEEERNEKLALIKKMLLTEDHGTPGSDQPAASSFKVGRKQKVSKPKRILTNTASNKTLKDIGESISETTYIRSNAGAALQDLDNQHPLSSMSRSLVTSLFKDNGVDRASNVNSFMITELSTPLFRNGPSNINRHETYGTTNRVVPYFSGGIENSLIHKNKENYHQDSDDEMDDEWYENAKTEPASQNDDDL